ncbi:YebC/PmpR family DNA-binding transcriptional regulator [Rhodocytophaga aerolata]|uniref:Probable transcriptional regulatory protein Q0590_20870 n=1 Tax=Rhodocytophaga aerolata TaxID=455078 RepID=A0ABT8R9G6_9BACT|nr:YebC/PmpR family DNA-binding transcriptional regulator [Rhodocytophaga aerolata]MDO1448742.1 YebC/PmpR family DNA-binding transcriptional regulator [Rhodocytophaga aerolata]
MGRAFEFRRARKEKRWDWMAKTFTKIGKEISIAVKQGGSDPENNPRLRTLIQNAKTNNMPKDRVESAIKRAASKDDKGYEEVIYEGYGPYGVAILVETATDNPTRTVANIRMYFNRGGGTLGKTGSLDFIFTRKGVFRIDANGIDKEELEFEMIDHGLDEIEQEENELVIYTPFADFARMQKFLEEKQIPVKSAELKRIPNTSVALNAEQEDEIMELIEKFEQDDDVQAVYHNVS